MKKVLVLGSGRVAGPLIRYLLDDADYQVTVASLEPEAGERLIAGHNNGAVVRLDLTDEDALASMVRGSRVVVSLVPYGLHSLVARHCIDAGADMVTTSYVSDEMRSLDEAARKAGVVLMNEIGLDPGLDHMSAMRLIDGARDRGAKVLKYYSSCGGIPAPAANTNPIGYKFSWNPRGALTAARQSGRYRSDGNVISIPAGEIYHNTWDVHIPGIGRLEAYPNRDSLMYIPLYGLEEIETIVRSTLRYPGWCDTMRALFELGLDGEESMDLRGLTLGSFVRKLNGGGNGEVSDLVAAKIGEEKSAPVMKRLEWLGLLGDDPISLDEGSPFDVLVNVMMTKMEYGPDESDMIVLRDQILVELADGSREEWTSVLAAHGVPGGDHAMARTVGLPAGVAAHLIAEEHVDETGVQIPTEREIYEPVLKELEGLGISFEETIHSVE